MEEYNLVKNTLDQIPQANSNAKRISMAEVRCHLSYEVDSQFGITPVQNHKLFTA